LFFPTNFQQRYQDYQDTLKLCPLFSFIAFVCFKNHESPLNEKEMLFGKYTQYTPVFGSYVEEEEETWEF